MKAIQIERRRNLTSGEFTRDHLQDVGKPVIVTDAIDGWPARSKWTFDYLKTTYGSDFATVTPSFTSDVVKLTKLGSYIDYLDTPNEELPGFWIEAKTRKPTPPPPLPHSPLYMMGWNALGHPELGNDIQPAPYFISDWLLSLTPTLRELLQWTYGRAYSAVFVGPPGSLSTLHYDFGHCLGYLAQIQGRKRATLCAPSDSPHLYAGQVDPEHPDLERFPLFEWATPYECVIEPGELLFMPAGWWHWVRGLEKSITVAHNFFNDVNFSEHLTKILRRLPRLVQAFDHFPDWRDELSVRWRRADLTDP
jgi:hypothetical protein